MRFAARPRYVLTLLVLLATLPATAATLTVTNTNDSGAGSLRQALLSAQQGDTIAFSIDSGPQTILPLTNLPSKTGIVIDGRTQPGYSGTPLIELDGSVNAGDWSSVTGLALTSSEVYGLAVNNFVGTGINLSAGVINNCYIGVDVTGTIKKGNGLGIRLYGGWYRAGVIGGGAATDGNLISGNRTGIAVSGRNVTIQGNTFGTDVTQTSVIDADTEHISVLNLNVSEHVVEIGGYKPNVFAGGLTGVSVFYSDGISIAENYFGTTPAGISMPIRTAIDIYQSSTNLVLENVIENNERGVVVSGNSLRNNIEKNSMAGNTFGINLVGAYNDYGTVTPNDTGDADLGPNNLVNFPILGTPKLENGVLMVPGTLSTVASRGYRIELFASPDCNASGHGEGATSLTIFEATSDADGLVTFNRAVVPQPQGTAITATATSLLEGTSEFSPCVFVGGPGRFAFKSTTTSVTEGSSFQLTVNRTNGAVGAVSVTYSVTGGTATAADHGVTGGTLDFAEGETSKSVMLTTTNDSSYEGNETIVITLSNATNGAEIGSPSTHTVTINDNDPPPAVTFRNVSIKEGDVGTKIAEVPALLSAPLGIPYTVPYTISSYYATAGVDYIAGGGSITFAPGETEKFIPVTIIGDTQFEQTEWVAVNTTSWPYSGANVAILNDDPVPAVSVNNVSVVEGNARKTVLVTLSAPFPVSGAIVATLIGGDAQPSIDFVPFATWIYFYGEQSKTIAIEILGDTEPEPDERFEISLRAPYPTELEAGPNGIVTIVNDDLGVGPAERWIAAGTKGTFTVRLGQSVAQNETIALTSSSPSGVSVPVTLVIPAGQSFADFDATALAAGHDADITLTFPPSLGGGTRTVRARTYTRATLRFSPERITIIDGKTASVSVSLDPPSANAVTIGLRSSDRVSVPASLTIPPGGSASFVIMAKKIGAFTVDAQLPDTYGNEVQSLAGDVIAPPTTPAILSITPSHGPTSGGTEVTINGTNLRNGCTVVFGGVPATSAQFTNATKMTAVTPPHAGGSVDVLLVCGTDTFTFANGFGYVSEAPRVSSVTPSNGTTAGGTHVRAGGTNFDGGCWLFFDRFAATGVVVRGDESITGVAPPHAAGASDVTVRCSAGTSTLPDAFTYRGQDDPAPLITEIVPAAAAPGELVTVRGLNFRPSDSAAVDTTPATIVDPSPDAHVIRVPELPAGRASVHVSDLFGHTTTSGPLFSILEARPPRITAVSPATVPAGGELELIGEGFRPGYTFEIGGHAATIVTSEYTRAIVRVGSAVAPGSHFVNVQNRANTLAAIGPNVQIVDDGMIVTSAEPRCTTTDGGIYATIRGRGFASGATASFDGMASPDVTVIDDETLRVQVPPGAAGPAQISVTSDGHTATLTNVFSYASAFDPRGCGGRSRTVRH